MIGDRDSMSNVVLDPFAEPEPSQETGPGTHFRSTFDRQTPEPSPPPYDAAESKGSPGRNGNSTNPFRQGSKKSATSTSHGYLTPPTSASPRTTEFDAAPRTQPGHHRTSSGKSPNTTTRNRSTSLTERYPGDQSHQPLAILRRESKKAQRSPHLNKRQLQGADTIDRLDLASPGYYHHEGPYDAASRARNLNWYTSPVAAVRDGNEETLKATPHENILDSVKRHRPLDGVGAVPSGATDRFGRRYEYQEGPNLMIEGMYKRWPGIEYKDEDIKGKGEPSFTLDKALKEHKLKKHDGEHAAMEMQTRRRNQSASQADAPLMDYLEQDIQRANSTGGRGSGSGLRKRIGSLRKRRE